MSRLSRMIRAASAFVLLSTMFFGCTYDPSFGDVACDTEGATDGNRACRDGYWVEMDAGNEPVDMAKDLTPVDMADMADMGCVAEEDEAFCTRTGFNCDEVTAVDNCGDARTVNCGVCTDPETCGGAGDPNVCGCTSESAADFCQNNVVNCDDYTGEDNCGVTRTENCGVCVAPASCGGGGTPNTCACSDQTDVDFCLAGNAECGAYEATDTCGLVRRVNCGTCTGTGESCGGAGTENQCGCTPEADGDFCSRLGKNCGSLTANDNCGAARTANCGSCTSPEGCGDGGTANVCGCPSAAATCGILGKDCNNINVSGRCSNLGTISCGTCTGTGESCGNSVPNVCGCTPENNATFCSRQGKDCGSLTANDNCGTSRTTNCGACNGTGESCGGSGAANVCGCTPEANSAFCTRLGKDCNTVSAADNCGDNRSTNCGSCSGFGDTCGGSGTTNVCGCTAESSSTFCSRQGKDCGSFSSSDNCGDSRTANCGSCSATGDTCAGGGVPNVCGCIAETNAAFCSRLGKDCGTTNSGTDNCGDSRSNVTCGVGASACGGTGETCGGGGTPGVCECAPQSNAAFCTAIGKDCGTNNSGTDNCGLPRNSITCGVGASACGGTGETCGGDGTPNVCGCSPQSDAAFCTAIGKDCGTNNSGTDNCGDSRTSVTCGVGSGACGGTGETCGGGGTTNVCGCTQDSDSTLCAANPTLCGTGNVTSNCGGTVSVTCSGVCGSDASCNSNVCECDSGFNGDPYSASCAACPSESNNPSCSDGTDNDCDGLVDCLDPDCDGNQCDTMNTDTCQSNVCSP